MRCNLSTTIHLGLTLLDAIAQNLGYSHAGDAQLIQSSLESFETNANNGLLGDMFANLPILFGLLLMPLLLILCFRLMDLATEKVPLKYLVPFCVFFASAFMNGSWGTVLLSHGFLVACLLLYIFPREEGLSQ